jgi:hypothetical protein
MKPSQPILPTFAPYSVAFSDVHSVQTGPTRVDYVEIHVLRNPKSRLCDRAKLLLLTTREENEILSSIRASEHLRGFALCSGIILGAGLIGTLVYGAMHAEVLDDTFMAELF